MGEAAAGRRWLPYVWMASSFLVMVGAWHFGTRQSGGIPAVDQRRAMPELAMKELDGGMWRMSEHRGQVVLVNYWATWCGPCWEETPGLIRLSRELGTKGLAVVGVAMDVGGEEKVRQFVKEFRVPYPVVMQEKASQMEYGLEGVPTTVLVDRNGLIAKSYVGAVTQADFETDVKALLAEQ
ncbi:MAG: TlpA disulfide reductase family protein [Edaphobacter sp.]